MTCSNCGYRASEDSDYCPKCGTALTAKPNPTPTPPPAPQISAAARRKRWIINGIGIATGVLLISWIVIWQTGLACGDSSTALTFTGLQVVFDPITPEFLKTANGITGEGCES